ncbi:MAG: DUF4129 domain-containing protein, partial [Pyrinomonadaceae bacterium]|nr:DUF4129 domain-containing protein [Pyrinomonadaceae bacterium]
MPENLSSHTLTRIAQAACLLLLILLGNAGYAMAIPLSAYRERVERAKVALDALHAMDEELDDISRAERVAQTLAEVRRILPPTDLVELGNTSMPVDNAWLQAALKNYEELPPLDARGQAILTETSERLGALAEALAALEQQQKAVGGSKDEDKARLQSILRRPEFAKKAAEDSALMRVLKQFLEWLSGLFPKRGPTVTSPGQAGFLSLIAQIVVVVLALAVIGYAVWKFGPRIWNARGRVKKKPKREARVVLGEHLEPDQTSADLLAEAEALAREGNLRAAIRKGYIALLCELGDRKILGLAQHKTNRDYLSAVRSQEQLYREMHLLTNSFENHWYGFVPASPEDWNMFRTHYQQA